MKIKEQLQTLYKSIFSSETKEAESSRHGVHEAYNPNRSHIIRSGVFDGEKTPNELGDVYQLSADHYKLRLRSYEAALTNDAVRIMTGKFFNWVVGSGLKLQSEPNEKALETEGIKVKDLDKFRNDVESRFRVFGASKMADYRGEKTLHQIAKEAFEGAFHGDVLIIMRIESGIPRVQLIDGEHVMQPFLADNNYFDKAKERGNIIRNGIEFDKKGAHVAYYVHQQTSETLVGTFERIECYGGRTKRRLAWLFGLKKHRFDNDRAIPIITPILEKLSKLDRYTEATVGTAEERAKIVYAIEHGANSTGENPLANNIKVATGKDKSIASETTGHAAGEETAAAIAQTTGKQTINMPIDSKLTAMYSQNEIHFEAFHNAIFKKMCAAIDIPPEVALQQYNSNYSASRAAINGWDYIVEQYRDIIVQHFYKPIYAQWLEGQIINGNIAGPGYIYSLDNFMVTEAYQKCRFVGAKQPHIDPLKEVKAVIMQIENNLMTYEQGAEKLQTGDWSTINANLKKEYKYMDSEKAKSSKNRKNHKGVIHLKPIADSHIETSNEIISQEPKINNDDEVSRSDLSIVKIVSNKSPKIGDKITFTLTVENNGPKDLPAGVTILNKLPSGFKYVNNDAIKNYDILTGEWSIGDLATNKMKTLAIDAIVQDFGDYGNMVNPGSSSSVQLARTKYNQVEVPHEPISIELSDEQ